MKLFVSHTCSPLLLFFFFFLFLFLFLSSSSSISSLTSFLILSPPQNTVFCIGFNRESTRMVTCSKDSTWKLWKIDSTSFVLFRFVSFILGVELLHFSLCISSCFSASFTLRSSGSLPLFSFLHSSPSLAPSSFLPFAFPDSYYLPLSPSLLQFDTK